MTISHNERFRTIGESTRSVVAAIVATWERANAQVIAEGAQWYDEAGRVVDDLAARTGRSREHVAAVIAQLSPRTTWDRNKSGAVMLLTEDVAPGCLAANVERARVALASPDPLGTINGPKTSRFARNILGDRQAVTVDTWAIRVALPNQNDPEKILTRQGVYEAVEHAYRMAAEKVGVDPATMQATTWVVARNNRSN